MLYFVAWIAGVCGLLLGIAGTLWAAYQEFSALQEATAAAWVQRDAAVERAEKAINELHKSRERVWKMNEEISEKNMRIGALEGEIAWRRKRDVAATKKVRRKRHA